MTTVELGDRVRIAGGDLVWVVASVFLEGEELWAVLRVDVPGSEKPRRLRIHRPVSALEAA